MQTIKNILKKLWKGFVKIICHGSKTKNIQESHGNMTTSNSTETSSFQKKVRITEVKINEINLK